MSEKSNRTSKGNSERQPKPLDETTLIEAYHRSMCRLLLLDFDGTLVDFACTPENVEPGEELLTSLSLISEDPCNTVAMVSGRPSDYLQRKFGHIARLWLVAEHGAEIRNPQGHWNQTTVNGDEWKCKVRPQLKRAAAKAPGSFVEEKKFGLVWHFRAAPMLSEGVLSREEEALAPIAKQMNLTVMRGNKILEVKARTASKANVLEQLKPLACADPDFLLFAGDDKTDEDLFAKIRDGWTIRVGAGPSLARFQVDAPSAIRDLLKRLASNEVRIDGQCRHE